jgi:cephalosporin-C deacetylase-like acetyl esterase
MTPERWQRIDGLLEQALDATPERRRELLDSACRGDPDLRRAVEELLGAHQRAEGFLRSTALELAARQAAADCPGHLIGRTIGHYEVISRLGAGGMGVVYLARDVKLDRLVALKFLPDYLNADETQKARFLREARAVSALDDANVATIHEIAETADGRLFIVMAYYEGETLKERIERGPLPIDQAVDLAIQIARGLARAHSRQIVHRDIKPGNIVVLRDGLVKIIDFGLAKISGRSTITQAGAAMGTVSYMSPEQAGGEDVDQRVDVWSLGVVLYEMLTARLPFPGEHPAATIHLILSGKPKPLKQLRADTPRALEQIVDRALQKDPAARYFSTAEMLADLSALQSNRSAPEIGRAGAGVPPAWLRKRRFAMPALVALLALAGWLGWLGRRQWNTRWAHNKLLPEIARLIDEDKCLAAFSLAREAEKHIPAHPLLVKLWAALSKTISIRTEPPGADVYIKEYDAPDSPWTFVGRSPLEKVPIPRGLFRWRVEKPGFVGAEDVASNWASLSFRLEPQERVPPKMVRLAGAASFKLNMPGFENAPAVPLPDYWMDRSEVTNKQFKQFVDSGGYSKPEYWKHPFEKDGRVIPWAEAVREFHDATGRPGPSIWEAGDYPSGQGDDPVGGVSWHEAAAYAEFAGKILPTIYHWNNAAITIHALVSSYILPLSNFSGRAPARVGSHKGMSRSGTYDMAGNVKEWCWNEADRGKRYILGGGWDEPAYAFHEADARSAFQRHATFGFRCVKPVAPRPTPEKALAPLAPPVRAYAHEQPVPDQIFSVYRDLYTYDKTGLNSVIESRDETELDWSRERITFDAAYGNERVIAHLFLPRNSVPPYQTVVHFPGAESILAPSSAALIELPRIDFLLKSGRAVLWPVYKGPYERGDDLSWYFPDGSASYRDHVIQWSKDLGRAIDYLESRPEIDRDKIAYYGFSWGACVGAILSAVEDRLKVSVLMGAGLYFPKSRPEVDQINFAPRVTIPTLMIDGRYDFLFPRETSQEPLFRLLGTPKEHKRLALFEGGHFVPRHHLIKETLDWMDRYLGPVRTKGR